MKEEDGDEVEPFIRVHILHVQQQKRDSDYVLFAIVLALHAILGVDMTNIQTVMMRNHLLHCLQTKHFDRFPKPKKSTTTLPYYDISLYCNCLMQEKDDMMMCDACEDWYNLRCIGLDKLPSATEQWICPSC